MRYFVIVRRNLVTAATVCSLLWAVTGVSVLAVALHEHHHHGETHDHHDVIEVVLHGHAHEGSPDHDHEFTSLVSVSRTFWSVDSQALVSLPNDLVDAEVGSVNAMANSLSEPRDLGPPAYLMHCVLLT